MTTRGLNVIGLEELLGGSAGHARQPQRPLPAAQLAELMPLAHAYVRAAHACEYKPLDLVTARTSSSYSASAGYPHVVLEVLPQFKVLRPDTVEEYRDAYGAGYYPMLDMRVLVLMPASGDHKAAVFWVESWQFEPYVPELHDAYAAARQAQQEKDGGAHAAQ